MVVASVVGEEWNVWLLDDIRVCISFAGA